MEVYDDFDRRMKKMELSIEDLDRRFRNDSRKKELAMGEQDDKIDFI